MGKKNSIKHEQVRKLGIDEFSMKKGHKYFACVLVDLETGSVIDVLKERTKEYLTKYFTGLGEKFCEQIKVLSCDMWQGFAGLSGTVFPNAELVIDRFYFSKNLNKTLDMFRKNLRKTLFKDVELHQGKLRFALLKSSDNLSNEEIEIRSAAFEAYFTLR